jgi:mono/diheme cytochrome c family protein
MRGFLAIMALAGFCLAGAVLAPAQETDESLKPGRQVFVEHCAQCHRTNGEGLPEKFPALNKNPFVVGDPNPVISTVLNGRKGQMGQMPYWKDKLNDEKIAAAITYIRNAWTNKAPGVSPEMVKALRGK